jgi:hypothetical protein
MPSPDDTAEISRVRGKLLAELTERLGLAEALAHEMRRSLVATDAAAIEAATAKAHNTALEFKLLADEYRRLPKDGAPSDELARAQAELEAAALRLARSAALGGGLLERMTTLRRGLLALLSEATGGTYLPSGRSSEVRALGVRVREIV